MQVHGDLFSNHSTTCNGHLWPFPVVQVSCGKKREMEMLQKNENDKMGDNSKHKKVFFYSNWSQWLSSPLDPLWIEVAKISHRKSPKVWETRQGYVGVWNDIAQTHAHALGHSMHAHPYSYAKTMYDHSHTHTHTRASSKHTHAGMTPRGILQTQPQLQMNRNNGRASLFRDTRVKLWHRNNLQFSGI